MNAQSVAASCASSLGGNVEVSFGVFAIAAIAGVFIGLLSGLLGVGGGVIMVPVFRLGFGLSAVASTATSLFTVIPTSISGAITHIRGKTCVPKLGIALGVGGGLTSPIGVQLAQLSPGWMVITAAALVIGYSSFTMLRKALAAPKKREQQGVPPQPDLATSDLVKAMAIGAVTGVASGYVGLGGGFIMVPLLSTVMGLPMRLTSGTSLIAVLILAIPASVVQCALGNVDVMIGVAVACGSIPGALIGARLVSRVPDRALRFIFSAFLGVGAVLLVLKEIGLMA